MTKPREGSARSALMSHQNTKENIIMNDDLHDGEWVTLQLVKARQNRERHLRAKTEIAERNTRLRVEILQHAMRDSFR